VIPCFRLLFRAQGPWRRIVTAKKQFAAHFYAKTPHFLQFLRQLTGEWQIRAAKGAIFGMNLKEFSELRTLCNCQAGA